MNIGAWPVDPTTEVGLFRTELGDVLGTPILLTTGLPGPTADFEFLSDLAIANLLLAYPTSRDMAMSRALNSSAFQLIAQAQDIQVDDIKIKTVERARLMFEMAIALGGVATATDASSAFNIVALNSHHNSHRHVTSAVYGESGF